MKDGQHITADIHIHGTGPRAAFTGMIVGTPTPNFARVLWKTRFCTRCNGYHAHDSTITHAIPASDTTYFEVRPATSHEMYIIEHDEILPECDDLDDGSDVEDGTDTNTSADKPPAITNA
eukprot:PhM_4_TR15885/c1_g1_i1/m.17042